MRLRAPHGPATSVWPLSHGRAGLFLLFAFLTLGCDKSGKGGANEVTGKVTLGDQPVAGDVVFVYADGKELATPIVDGKYTMPDAPTGPVKVFIRPGLAASGKLVAPKGGPEAGGGIPVAGGGSGGAAPPQQYQSAATSGLTYEVKAGKQTYDIPLK